MSTSIPFSENSSSRSDTSDPQGKSSMAWTASCNERRFLVMLIYKWKIKNFFLEYYLLYIYFVFKKKLSTKLLKKIKIIAFLYPLWSDVAYM